MIGVFDFDYVKYQIAFAGEDRYIVVRHPSGIEQTFKTRTDFYGSPPEYTGGWLAEYNKDRKEPLKICEFTIEDVQVPEPLSHVLSTVKKHLKHVKDNLNLSGAYGYIGQGDSWRVEKSTLLKYKGQRGSSIKPVYMKEIEEYLCKYHNAVYIRGLEADDQCVIDCYQNKDKVLIGVDKDFLGCNKINLYVPRKGEEVLRSIDGLGSLHNSKSGIKGEGRSFFYFQVLSGDKVDNYKANCMSDIKWGDKAAYKALVKCKTDKECWQALVDCYKRLYPAKKIVKGWRGDAIEIDWLYVLQENVTMAHMLRWEGDFIDVPSTLSKLGVDWEK